MTRAFALACGALLTVFLAAPLPGSVTAKVGEGPFHVGDPIPIEVSFPVVPGQDPLPPRWAETWGDAEIRELGPVEVTPAEAGASRATQEVVITFFRSGEFALPLPPLEKGLEPTEENAADLRRLTVTVESLLPAGEQLPPPRPPAPPEPLPWGAAFIWIVSLLTMLVLAAVGILLTRLRPAAERSSVETDDPLTELTRALDGMQPDGDIEKLFTGLSHHFRHFLGRALAFPAVESTTLEIRRFLRQQQLPAEITTRSERLLQQCDGVKFARHCPTSAEVSGGIQEARTIGTETTAFLSRLTASEEAVTK